MDFGTYVIIITADVVEGYQKTNFFEKIDFKNRSNDNIVLMSKQPFPTNALSQQQ